MSTPNEATVGWRFSPKDEELINYFLRQKINGKDDDVKIIREIDVCRLEPWDLPGQSVLKSDDNEWFFFCPPDQKFPSSSRLNRATSKGYWKATGKDRKIKSKSMKSDIGMKKTLVFHIGRAPNGKRTYWIMHEYRTTLKELDGTHPGQRPYVLCRLFKKDDDTVSDTTDNIVEDASLSSIPCEPSVMELKHEAVSYQAGSFSEKECEKALVISEHCDGESSKAIGQEPQLDMNLEYLNWFVEPDPNDVTLLESPTVESMESSLLPHSDTNSFYINGNDDFTSDFLQSILTDSLDYRDVDFEFPGHEFMNQFEVHGMDSEVFLQSNLENTDDMTQLAAELEPYVSNADSSDPIPVTQNTFVSFQSCVSVGSSSTENNSSGNDRATATHTEIQIRPRQLQLQTRPDNTKSYNHGTAQRRIRLQKKLGTSLISTESMPKQTKQTVIKKFITSISSLTISGRFILGLASISLTMFFIYTGLDYISS